MVRAWYIEQVTVLLCVKAKGAASLPDCLTGGDLPQFLQDFQGELHHHRPCHHPLVVLQLCPVADPLPHLAPQWYSITACLYYCGHCYGYLDSLAWVHSMQGNSAIHSHNMNPKVNVGIGQEMLSISYQSSLYICLLNRLSINQANGPVIWRFLPWLSLPPGLCRRNGHYLG